MDCIPPAHNNPPCVLIMMAHYLPGFKAGGPIRSVANMVDHLGSEFDFHIVTSDRDLGDKEPYPGIVRNVWTQVSNAKVIYVRRSIIGLPTIWKILTEKRYSILCINGVFSKRFSIFPLLAHRAGLAREVPLIISLRGEFSPAALKIHSKRKRLFLTFMRLFRLTHGIVWHASSEFERQDILRQFAGVTSIEVRSGMPMQRTREVKQSILIAADVNPKVTKEELGISPHKEPGRLKIVFVSRVSRMKNLDGAIRLLTGLSGSIEFHIYGPIEDRRYWQKCTALIKAVDRNIQINYCGVLRPEEVSKTFSQYHLFLLPTHGENFGHVIAESLAAGCPVLISDQTPWRDLERLGVGWDFPLDQPERFHAVLKRCVEMGGNAFRALSLRAKVYGLSKNCDQEPVNRQREMFLHIMRTHGFQ